MNRYKSEVDLLKSINHEAEVMAKLSRRLLHAYTHEKHVAFQFVEYEAGIHQLIIDSKKELMGSSVKLTEVWHDLLVQLEHKHGFHTKDHEFMKFYEEVKHMK
ncbi:MAG: hypothetical protein U9R00_00070 [Patescibacteria group bacterium]|nr:hypothetical protein [Patescibacteria group bacterium]